jgi:outer membrane protein assembly factor BamB
MSRLVLLLGMCLLLPGCGYMNSWLRGTDNSIPPSELTDIAAPLTPALRWERRVSSGTGDRFIDLVPAIIGGRGFVAGHEGDVSSLDAATGEVLWRVETDLPISAGVGVGDGLALVGTIDGEVLALSAVDGAERWRARLSSEVLAPPQAADGVAVVRTVDGTFTGLNVTDGQRRWVFSYTVPPLSLRGAAPPLLAQGLVIAGLDTGKLLVLTLENGVPVWEQVIAPPRGRTELDRIVDIDSAPTVVRNLLFVAAYQGNVTAIDLSSGNTVWSRDFSNHNGLDADLNGVYLPDEISTVWGLEVRNGAPLWRQEALVGRRLSAPVVAGDYVVLGDFEGYLHWLDARTGQLRGRVRADNERIRVAPQYVDGLLYTLDDGGTLSVWSGI